MAQEGNIAFQEFFAMASLAESIKLLPWCISSAVPPHYISEALAATMWLGENTPATTAAWRPEESPTPGSLSSPTSLTATHPPQAPFLTDLPFVGTPHGTISEKKGQELVSPPSSPTRATIDLEDRTAARSLKSTKDQTSSDSESSRENVDDSNLDTASRDCISCSVTYEVSISTACKKYRKRVWASCRLSKRSLWMEAQLKRINDSCQDMWGQNYESVRTEKICTLAEDCNSFEIQKKWWSVPANCSASLRLLVPKFTLERQRPKPTTRWKLWYCC